jgi:hypothetical protein
MVQNSGDSSSQQAPHVAQRLSTRPPVGSASEKSTTASGSHTRR